MFSPTARLVSPVGFARLTLDYQLINNPAYNRNRGPVSVPGLRAHAEC
jgi:high affinity Mn2+ porin